jgi:hypothetical protein
VLDLAVRPARILRDGPIGREALAEVVELADEDGAASRA